ncbi:MAG: protein-export chaperone SecB [Magnetospirillum sp.]|nr:protein-export chaperone SecB [Magnetospirillum sp.]
MTDANPQELPPLVVNGQYIKDLSFEVPGAPAIFGELERSPDIPVSVDITVNPLREKTYEVILHLKIDAHVENKPVFIVEVDYGGVFTLNVPQEHVQPMLLVECPRLLFPFVRNIVADLTRDGGFPPLMMQPIDFVQLYRARMAQAAETGQVGHA